MTKTVDQRFDCKIDKNGPIGMYRAPPTPCWLWLAGKDTYGYGVFNLGLTLGNQSSHRFSYERQSGLIPEGAQLDHLCRVRHCCNFDHLELVTPKENVQRGLTMGNTRNTGIKNFSAKLTEEQVVLIRKDERFQREIAKDFNISQRQVSVIKNNKYWKHVK